MFPLYGTCVIQNAVLESNKVLLLSARAVANEYNHHQIMC